MTSNVFSHIAIVVDNLEALWTACESLNVQNIQASIDSGPARGALIAPSSTGYGDGACKLIMRIEITALVEKPKPSVAVEPEGGHHAEWQVADNPEGIDTMRPLVLGRTEYSGGTPEPNVVVDRPDPDGAPV